MNNEAIKQGAARAVPVSTLSTYVAAPAAPAYATASATAAAPALAAIPGDDLAPDGAITAILPIYDDNGRGIVIYTADGGRRVTGRRMRSILQHLAERNCRTIPLIRRRMKDLLGGRQELPLPISPQLLLVPCKVITPRVKGDETIGYFSLAHIRALHTLPHRSHGHAAELPVYELSDGRRVALLCTSDTARHRLEMAAYARCLMFGA